MTEQISIREAARRLGVSDTAIHKAIKDGRITPPEKNGSGRAFFHNFKKVSAEFKKNSSESKRSHVGSRGSSRREDDEPQQLQVSSKMGTAIGEIEDELESGERPRYEQSRALREAYNARLAKLEYEEKTGKLVSAEEVKTVWYKHIAAAKTRIMGIPAACKSRHADLPLSVIAIIEQVCREALEDLANGSD